METACGMLRIEVVAGILVEEIERSCETGAVEIEVGELGELKC